MVNAIGTALYWIVALALTAMLPANEYLRRTEYRRLGLKPGKWETILFGVGVLMIALAVVA